jgi:hypothetical protein
VRKTLLKNQSIIEERREEIEKSRTQLKCKQNLPEALGYSKGVVKREVYSYEHLHQRKSKSKSQQTSQQKHEKQEESGVRSSGTE